jgi:hypothetical protein
MPNAKPDTQPLPTIDVADFVVPVERPKLPDYAAVKRASDERLAEEAHREAIERERLEAIQAAERAREAQPVRYTAPTVVAAPGGSCASWMAAAGITDTTNAYTLIMRESGCNPNAVNRSSGACGIGQQLPCGKWPHVWNDPVGAMIDMQGYVFARYGSWANAVAFHNAHNYY